MRLYYGPGTCAMGIHLLLEEIGQPYEKVRLNFAKAEHKQAAYLAINPKAKVPALETDGHGVITELPAIAFYLAKTYPGARLLPEEIIGQVRALELLEYATATVHMRGWTRIVKPAQFSADGDPELVKKEGMAIFTAGLDLLARTLGDKPYALGEFSIADAGLFILEQWAGRGNIQLPEKLAAHYDRMIERPAVQRMLEQEGLKAARHA